MTNELAVTYEVDGQTVNLSPGLVLKYMLGLDPERQKVNIPDKEISRIIALCQARNLNPYTGDIVVTPYTDKNGKTTCSMIVTKDFFTRRADANPRYKGKEAGVCVLSADGRPVKREGSCVYKDLGERLIGGWCRVHIEGREPEYAEVSLSEYDTQRSIWKTKPGTMIRKVAVSQALREAFPNDFNGLYEPEEMGVGEDEIRKTETGTAEITEVVPLYETDQNGVDWATPEQLNTMMHGLNTEPNEGLNPVWSPSPYDVIPQPETAEQLTADDWEEF